MTCNWDAIAGFGAALGLSNISSNSCPNQQQPCTDETATHRYRNGKQRIRDHTWWLVVVVSHMRRKVCQSIEAVQPKRADDRQCHSNKRKNPAQCLTLPINTLHCDE